MTNSFDLSISDGVATVTLSRPNRLNALTFETYTELADWFANLSAQPSIRAVVLQGEGRAFCSGGDQDDIIANLLDQPMERLLRFTRLTGRLIANIRECSVPVVAALSGAVVGAGAVIAIACDFRIAAEDTKFGFIFPRVGLCGADMGATYLLPRIVGLGVASELLFFGEIVGGERSKEIGLVNRLVANKEEAQELAQNWARRLADGPTFAHAMTKKMLEAEATMSLSEAIEAEAQAQAICMAHVDFAAAHKAFKEKKEPVFWHPGDKR